MLIVWFGFGGPWVRKAARYGAAFFFDKRGGWTQAFIKQKARNVTKLKIFGLIFLLSGTAGVLGVLPYTQDLSNLIGAYITELKTGLGTTGTPVVVK